MFSVRAGTSRRPAARPRGRPGQIRRRSRNTRDASIAPLISSVFCELTITDFAGSKVSSLCSPLVKSQSTETPARNCPRPERFERGIDLGQQILLDLLPVFETGFGGLGTVRRAGLRGRLSRLPFMSSTVTAPGAVLPRRWPSDGRWRLRSAATSCAPGRSFTSTLALAGFALLRERSNPSETSGEPAPAPPPRGTSRNAPARLRARGDS